MATSPLPLVEQLRFTRSGFRRGLCGTPEADGGRCVGKMNSIGWIEAHIRQVLGHIRLPEFVDEMDGRARYGG